MISAWRTTPNIGKRDRLSLTVVAAMKLRRIARADGKISQISFLPWGGNNLAEGMVC